MDSFTLYRTYFNKRKIQRFRPEEDQRQIKEDQRQIKEVIDAVFKELNSPPFELKNSSFIVETANIIRSIENYLRQFWKDKPVAIIDAVGVIGGVKNCFRIPNYKFLADTKMISTYGKNFFDDAHYQSEPQFIEQIKQDLNDIQSFLQAQSNMPEPENFTVAVESPASSVKILQSPPTAPPVSIPAKPSSLQDFRARPTASPAQSPAKPSGLQDFRARPTASPAQSPAKPSGLQDFGARSTAPPAQSPAKSSVMQDYEETTKAKIEFQKYIAATEADRTEQLKMRREGNTSKIKAWHEEQARLMQSVKELQSPAQKLLESFMNFSNNLTENYIVQFAKTQIELFNLITDNYTWHASRAETSRNKDYYKAVDNYREYLDMIIDALADFGIEEISDERGTRFNGKLHDVKNTKNFYPQTATIKKNLRPGFRYGELILQKEEVEV